MRKTVFAAALTLAILEDSTDYFDSCKSFAHDRVFIVRIRPQMDQRLDEST